VLDMVRAVAALDMEVCCTLGMLNESQAKRLKDAGLTAYNHNLDTSPEFYGNIITTHVYESACRPSLTLRKAASSRLAAAGFSVWGKARRPRRPAARAFVRIAAFAETLPRDQELQSCPA